MPVPSQQSTYAKLVVYGLGLAILTGADGGCPPFGGSGQPAERIPPVTGSCDHAREVGHAALLAYGSPGTPDNTQIHPSTSRPDCPVRFEFEVTSDDPLAPTEVNIKIGFAVSTMCAPATSYKVALKEVPINDRQDTMLTGSVRIDSVPSCLEPLPIFGLPFSTVNWQVDISREQSARYQRIDVWCWYRYVPYNTWNADDCQWAWIEVKNSWAQDPLEVRIEAREGNNWVADIASGASSRFKVPPGRYTISALTSSAENYHQPFLDPVPVFVGCKDCEWELLDPDTSRPSEGCILLPASD